MLAGALCAPAQHASAQCQIAKLLAEKEVGTRPFFLGMHQQPIFQRMGFFKGEQYPVTERIAQQGLYLPSGLTLTENQIEKVCQAIREILRVP